MQPIVKAALVPAILAASITAADVLTPRTARAQGHLPAEALTLNDPGGIATNSSALEASTTLEHHRGHHGHHRRRRRRRVFRHLFH